MTNKEAIKILSQIMDILLKSNSWLPSTKNPIKESFGMAIDALTAQEKAQEVSNDSPELDNNIGDLISRQAAIVSVLKGRLSEDDSLVESVEECNSMIEWAADVLKNLPSAHPDIEEDEDIPMEYFENGGI